VSYTFHFFFPYDQSKRVYEAEAGGSRIEASLVNTETLYQNQKQPTKPPKQNKPKHSEKKSSF
jgi:hypothetical protein